MGRSGGKLRKTGASLARAGRLVRLGVLAVLASSAIGRAGLGSIDDGKMDLTVYFTYDETDMSAWKPVFDEFSRLFYDATEKQLQLGEVRFTKCPGHRDIADVWVGDGTGDASATLNGIIDTM